jgi:hypothetical protein
MVIGINFIRKRQNCWRFLICKQNQLKSIHMKKQFFLVAFAVLAFLSNVALAQDKEDKSKRPSPPEKAEGTIDGTKVVIEYGAPSAKGRKIFGGLEPYDKVWRTGANETTSFEVDKNIKVEGKELAKGKYALFTIPGEKEWTIIFNKTIKWGAYDYKESEDVLRVKVPAGKTKSLVEKFTISIEGKKVVLRWENTEVAFALKG